MATNMGDNPRPIFSLGPSAATTLTIIIYWSNEFGEVNSSSHFFHSNSLRSIAMGATGHSQRTDLADWLPLRRAGETNTAAYREDLEKKFDIKEPNHYFGGPNQVLDTFSFGLLGRATIAESHLFS